MQALTDTAFADPNDTQQPNAPQQGGAGKKPDGVPLMTPTPAVPVQQTQQAPQVTPAAGPPPIAPPTVNASSGIGGQTTPGLGGGGAGPWGDPTTGLAPSTPSSGLLNPTGTTVPTVGQSGGSGMSSLPPVVGMGNGDAPPPVGVATPAQGGNPAINQNAPRNADGTVTAAAANNPVGNAAINWVVDPLSGGYVQKGQENVMQPNGQWKDGAGNLTDPAGTTHTYYSDGSAPGGAPLESMQRPGGPVEWAGGHAPAAGQFGGASLPTSLAPWQQGAGVEGQTRTYSESGADASRPGYVPHGTPGAPQFQIYKGGQWTDASPTDYYTAGANDPTLNFYQRQAMQNQIATGGQLTDAEKTQVAGNYAANPGALAALSPTDQAQVQANTASGSGMAGLPPVVGPGPAQTQGAQTPAAGSTGVGGGIASQILGNVGDGAPAGSAFPPASSDNVNGSGAGGGAPPPIAGALSGSGGAGATGAGGAPLIDSTQYGSLIGSDAPGGNYLGQTIQPGAGVDREKLAESNWENFTKATDPYYQKSLRDAKSSAAAGGQLGSGQFRTSLGDLANQRNLQLDTEKQSLLNDATSGSIGDQFAKLGIAQQQQGFQAGQQNTAFNQALQQQYLQEALQQGDYGRALGLLSAGEQGNPSSTALGLSGLYGNQASAAGAGAAGLIGNAANANNQRQQTAMMQQLLASMGYGAGAGGGGNGGSGGGINWGQILQQFGPQFAGAVGGAGQGGVQVTPNNTPTPPIIPTGPIHQPTYPG